MRALFAVSALALAAVSAAQIGSLTYLGSQTIETKSLHVDGTTVGGLSGIEYDAANDKYLIISDARVATPEEAPYGRFYTATIPSLAGGTFGPASVSINSVTTLKTPSGAAFGEKEIDPESIRLHGGSLYVSSEGDRSGTVPAQDPFVRKFDLSGNHLAELPLPDKFKAVAGSTTQGIRNNLAFESLAFTPDGLSLYTATENALYQDGPLATTANGSNSRVLRYDLTSGLAAQEYVYHVEPVAAPSAVFTVNGLVELLAVDNTHLLALERSFSVGVGNSIKLYEIDLSGATNVSGIASVADLTGITPVAKRLVIELNAATGLSPAQLDNVEGITFGPTLADGSRTLVLVSDDNFNSTVGTQFFAFKVQAVPEPGTWAALGLGATALLRKKRRG